MYIILRTCGGLGNQIFQSFYAHLIGEKYSTSNIYHHHSTNYKRFAPWENAFNFQKCNIVFRLLLKFRLPKILFRLGLLKTEYLKIGPLLIVDGYFMNTDQYNCFSKEQINFVLCKIRNNVCSDFKPVNKTLVHLRLGDFFDNIEDETTYLNGIFLKVKESIDVISSDDQKVLAYLKKNPSLKIQLVKTTNWTGLDISKFASNYNKIIYNGSTLVFWSSILSGSSLSFDYELLQNNYMKRNCINLVSLELIFRHNR